MSTSRYARPRASRCRTCAWAAARICSGYPGCSPARYVNQGSSWPASSLLRNGADRAPVVSGPRAQVREPAQVRGGAAVVPERHRHRRHQRVVVEPAAVGVPVRHEQRRDRDVFAELRVPLRAQRRVRLGVGLDQALADDRVEGGPHQVEEGLVAGRGGSRQPGDRGRLTDAVPAVRPAPAVVAAVPAAVEPAADHAVRTDVVRKHAAVRGRPLPPGSDVLRDPVLVALLAGQDPGVQHQAGRREVHGGVPGAEPGRHLACQPRVSLARRRRRPAGQQPVQRKAVEPFLVLQPRIVGPVEQASATGIGSVVRAADDLVLGVVVTVRGVDVELGEPDRPVPPPSRRRHAQEVQQQQALALVEPVVATLVLVSQQAKLGQLRGDSFPVPLGLRQQIVGTAEEVKLRPVEEGLVEVVGAVPGC